MNSFAFASEIGAKKCREVFAPIWLYGSVTSPLKKKLQLLCILARKAIRFSRSHRLDFTNDKTFLLLDSVNFSVLKMFSQEEQQIEICLLKTNLEKIGDDLCAQVSVA